ncbi:substrate-binding periplasmic protein [Qipengyuania soli]|uniref:Transporter substrate-binding domain-containing protein n=1 Tax=Qipengyuania soli TaxID=2782568 RepID=A0A7S8F2P3_9SPHN|nr:transporter substrate-binding domain-containing protein [Qipengyuania soli]QPC98046.1 transporter substrate-binding domain-containing protein [Qipengyuania soli]
MDRRGFIAGLVGAAGALAVSSPLSAAPLEKVRELGVLRIGLYNDYRPWSWEREGRPAGIDVDIAKVIAEKLGLRADVVLFAADEEVSDDLRNVVWRGGLLGFQPCDVMLHVPFDLEFAKQEDQVAFIAPYYHESFTGICSSGTRNCDAPPQLFVGKPVAAEIDSIPDFYLLGGFGGILRGDIKHYPSGYAAAEAVQAGDAEMAVATKAQIEAAIADRPDAGAQLRKSPLPLMPSRGWDIGMAVKENSRSLGFAIEDVVAEMASSGRMTEIFAGHGVAWEAAEAAKPLA